MEVRTDWLSPLGPVILAANGEALTGLWFRGQKYEPRDLDRVPRQEDLSVFRDARSWLERYFSGRDPGPPPPLAPLGTAFQQEVWAHLAAIPYGATRTYGEIAAQMAFRRDFGRMSARAVGSAVGRNKISLMIPCHRVVGAAGALTGYAGGLERKKALLALEAGEGPLPTHL